MQVRSHIKRGGEDLPTDHGRRNRHFGCIFTLSELKCCRVSERERRSRNVEHGVPRSTVTMGATAGLHGGRSMAQSSCGRRSASPARRRAQRRLAIFSFYFLLYFFIKLHIKLLLFHEFDVHIYFEIFCSVFFIFLVWSYFLHLDFLFRPFIRRFSLKFVPNLLFSKFFKNIYPGIFFCLFLFFGNFFPKKLSMQNFSVLRNLCK